MVNMINAKDAAIRWGLTDRRITGLCRSGKIPGAIKKGGLWFVPEDAQRPTDGRVRTGAYKKAESRKKLPLPVGISDYRIASTQYYYVDKTLMIRDFLDERPMVSLFTRPRRFGKTLNMDMLRTYFEISDEDTSAYFRDKAIWRAGEFYRSYQGKFPVVSVTFKDIKCETWGETLEKLAEVIGNEYARHEVLLESERCNEVDKGYFRRVMERTATSTELTSAFMTLTKMLHEHYQTAPIMIIDEYDTPIQQGHTKGFYDQVILFMRNLFSGGLKDNSHLSFGFMTGILRVAKESIFSGLNNLTINSILDKKYSAYFGFTADEVRSMAAYYGARERYEEICEWYDGYRFGGTEIFNPWSVINYFRNDCHPGAYWQSTGSNEIIGEVLTEAGADIYERLQSVLQGESFLTYIDTDVIYPEIRRNPSSVYSFLLVAGYLKLVNADETFTNGLMCEVALPNREIAFVYKKEILDQLTGIVPPAVAVSIQEALFSGNERALQQSIGKLLLESVSVFDTAGENFYHGLVLGLCAMMDNRYHVYSNHESGDGRYDISLIPKVKTLPGILIELKAAGKNGHIDLKQLAQTALSQIGDKRYETEMVSLGITTIIRYGVAFMGKDVEIAIS
ncbi:MAG: AAA family ATPase [Clostridia bacterium]|nr:AAA family ATPase [Clostridia bacterium]